MLWLTLLFVVAVFATTALQLWLSRRQIAAVARHRESVPEPFVESVSAADHRKAADYTTARVRFGRIGMIVHTVVTLALTVGGGIAAVDGLWRRTGWGEPWLGTAVIATVACVAAAINLPLSIWRTFRLEARFGFNRTTPLLFLADLAKNLLLAVLLGGPLLLVTLLLMERAGRWWWAWAWLLWLGLTFLMTWAWPAFIAPRFNRFSPLEDEVLKSRIEALLRRCGFASKGVFVVDSSRRSTHGNAYFTGIGRHKRIVFFDTLLERHFRLHHVRKRLLLSIATTFVGLALLGWLAGRPAFYAAFGVPVPATHAALMLFVLVVPFFTFFATPLASLWSRRHEFEADTFAARHSSSSELAAALVKLYRDNASTLTPDPVYAAFYYSHPPAVARIARLRAAD